MEGPDVGWAWVVAFSACMMNFIMAGLGRMSGILFVAFIEIFGVDRKSASTPFSVRSSARNLFGPVVGILGQKYGPRKVIITGAFLATLSCSACFFTPDIIWITVLWGGVNGLATALTVTLPQVVIGQYFIKHRTTAAGMAYSGGCVGSFMFPVFLEYLLHNFEINGSFLIIGGIIMHTIPAALILRKPPWLKNGAVQKKDTEAPNLTESLNNLVKEIEDNNVIGNKETNIPSVNECISNRFRPKITEGECLKQNGINFANNKTSNLSENACTLKNGTLKSALSNSAIYPDLKLLQENGELVEKILNLKSKRNSNPKLNQQDLCAIAEIESLYSSLPIFEDISHANKSLDHPKLNLFNGGEKDYLKVVCEKKHHSFNSGKKLPEKVTPRVYSVPDMPKCLKAEVRTTVLNKLSEILELDEKQVFNSFPEEKNQVVLILTELRILSKFFLQIDDRAAEIPEEKQIASAEDSKLDKRDGPHSNSFSEHIKTALKLYVNPMFLMVCFCRSAHFIIFIPTMTTVVDFSMDKGLPEDYGKYVIAAISLGDLLGRLCLGWITDRGFMSLPKYMMVVMVMQGISTATLPLMHTEATIFSSLALFGMLQGSLFVRHPVLVSRYMRSHEQAIAMGCVNFFSGLLGFGLPLYIGYFRDTVGSYDYIFYINGMIGASVGLLWAFEPFFVRCVNAKRTTQKIIV